MRAGTIADVQGHVPLHAHLVERSIPDLFHEVVERHGDRPAVVDDAGSITYAELDEVSNGIAWKVSRHARGRRVPVAVAMRQGRENIAAILGVLKAGAAYVPVDPAEPVPSARAVGAVALLTAGDARGAAVDGGLPIVDCCDTRAGRPPQAPPAADALAYVFPTSGSTGEEKAVFDNHRNVVHNVLRYTNTLQVAPADRMSLVQAPTFSGTVSTVFSALLNGASLYPLPIASCGVAGLAERIRVHRLTMLHFVPSILRALARTGSTFPSVRVVRVEGDAASGADVEHFRRAFGVTAALVNGFGTTETGLARQLVVAAETAVEPGPLPIGYPVAGIEASILDDAGEPAAPGRAGRIAFTGDHLALGYWLRPDLTARAFREGSGGRTYLTGDLGRLSDDGCLTHLGRVDHLRKLRGVWIDTSRIAAEIETDDAVDTAVVAARETQAGAARLAAWIVPAPGRTPSVAELRRHLRRALPASHAPSDIVVVDELPLTEHGKVDVGALVSRPRPAIGARRRPDDLERRLLAVWEDVLETRPIGVSESFFDLGGDSLAASEIVAWIEREVGGTLGASVLHEAPTVERLASLIGAKRATPSRLECLARAEGTPLFFVHDWDGNVGIYRELADSLDVGPVWGVRQPVAPPTAWTLERRASDIVDAMRSIQPAGGFQVAGHCFGAVLAFEVAHQLAAAGEAVDLLLLLGVSPWDFPLVSRDAWQRYAASLGYAGLATRARRAVETVRTGGARRAVGGLVRAAPTIHRHMRIRRGARPVQQFEDAFRRGNVEAFRRYRPNAWAGTAVLILASDTTALYTDDPCAAWSSLASSVVTHVVPGNDADMLRRPGVVATARIVSSSVRSV